MIVALRVYFTVAGSSVADITMIVAPRVSFAAAGSGVAVIALVGRGDAVVSMRYQIATEWSTPMIDMRPHPTIIERGGALISLMHHHGRPNATVSERGMP
jgi:hypothetical protein